MILRHPFTVLVALFWCLVLSRAATPEPPTVGMEGRLEIVLPVPNLEGRPVTDRSPVVVRVAAVYPHGSMTRYDLRYIGLKPGPHDLRDYLVLAGGEAPTNLPPIPVNVTGLLPPRHDGRLEEAGGGRPPHLGGYRKVLWGLGAAWIAGWVVWFSTRPKPTVTVATAGNSPGPTLAERLRPLVEAAARRELKPDGQAQLERLLLGYWRERLGWQSLPADEALARLRGHPEAGLLLRQLEDWLHRPPGAVTVDVDLVLAPYSRIPATPAPEP